MKKQEESNDKTWLEKIKTNIIQKKVMKKDSCDNNKNKKQPFQPIEKINLKKMACISDDNVWISEF